MFLIDHNMEMHLDKKAGNSGVKSVKNKKSNVLYV